MSFLRRAILVILLVVRQQRLRLLLLDGSATTAIITSHEPVPFCRAVANSPTLSSVRNRQSFLTPELRRGGYAGAV